MQDLLICHDGCIHTVHVWQSSSCPAYLLFSQQASKPDLQHGQSHILQDAACLNAIRQLTCSLVCPERMSAGNLQSAKLIRCGLEAEDAMLALLHEIILPRKRTIFLYKRCDLLCSFSSNLQAVKRSCEEIQTFL